MPSKHAQSRRVDKARPGGRRPRRGVASVLAMMYVSLFAVLAVGFYAATTISGQISRNERGMFEAQLAAESGLQFMRYQVARLAIPPTTTSPQMPAQIQSALKSLLEGTGNLGTGKVTLSGSTVSVPSIALGANTSFSTTVQWIGPVARVTVAGAATTGQLSTTRTVQTDFTIKSKASSVLNYGVASNGPVTIKSAPTTKVLGTPDSAGSILSADTGATTISTGKGTIDGDLAVTVAASEVSLGGGSVGGSSINSDILANHIHVVPVPEFPTIDTAPFKALAVNTYSSGVGHQKNIRVPPNTNPRFNGGDVVDGILYVESPNAVTFRGGAQINGIIVFENKNNSSVNSLDFKGNVQPDNIPTTAEFDNIRAAAKGLSIVAPTASISMSGSTDGYLDGSLIAYSLDLAGSADLYFTQGSIITLGPAATQIEGKTVNFTGVGSDNPPTTGVLFSGSLRPSAYTYRELP